MPFVSLWLWYHVKREKNFGFIQFIETIRLHIYMRWIRAKRKQHIYTLFNTDEIWAFLFVILFFVVVLLFISLQVSIVQRILSVSFVSPFLFIFYFRYIHLEATAPDNFLIAGKELVCSSFVNKSNLLKVSSIHFFHQFFCYNAFYYLLICQ